MARARWIVCWVWLGAAGFPGCGGGDSGTPDADAGDGAGDVPDVVETADEAAAEDARDVHEADVSEVADGDAEDEGGDVAFCATQPDGTSCDDGDPCTTGEVCAVGVCLGGTAVVCDDSDPCTDDACDPGTGDCTFTANTAPCDDGDPCTLDDACADDACVPGAPRDCSGLDDACNTDACDSSSGDCVAVPLGDGTACDDGDACTLDDTCTGGVCGSAGAVDCTAFDDACNIGTCQPADGSCLAVPLADTTVCDDGVSCTTNDHCHTGACSGDLPDADGDGYSALGCLGGTDCEDEMWDVNPGATEGPVGRATCFDHLDNDCDGASDLADDGCAGLDFAVLDGPVAVTVIAGATTPLIRGRVYEPGETESAGPMAGLTAELGWGPYYTDPTDNAAWTWLPAEYLGQGGPGGAHDVYATQFAAPAVGEYSTAYRFSTDGGATWLYADTDGNGAAPPSNGIHVDQLGTLDVIVNDHLLLSEVCVVPTNREFIEIYNPTAATVDLSHYYLTDTGDNSMTWRYWDLVAGSGTIRAWDFVVRFPDGATIGPREHAVVATGSAATFFGPFHFNPTFEMNPGSPDDPTVPDMVPAWSGSAGDPSVTGMLTNSYETLILFYWDGTTDLVKDVDIFQWGNTDEAVDKTGISRDGPDAGTATSAYFADTPVAVQTALTPAPHDSVTGSFERVDFSETGEQTTGGNGITGHDETSEDWRFTWHLSTAASPGS